MKKLLVLFTACSLVMSLTACGNGSKEDDMFIEHVNNLIQTANTDDEEQALGELLAATRQTNVNYGYRVFNKTKDKRVMPDELDNMLDDDLVVTIFVGEEAPYQEFEWRPKYNGHVSRLVMP
jgi:hypothetical protein